MVFYHLWTKRQTTLFQPETAGRSKPGEQLRPALFQLGLPGGQAPVLLLQLVQDGLDPAGQPVDLVLGIINGLLHRPD